MRGRVLGGDGGEIFGTDGRLGRVCGGGGPLLLGGNVLGVGWFLFEFLLGGSALSVGDLLDFSWAVLCCFVLAGFDGLPFRSIDQVLLGWREESPV